MRRLHPGLLVLIAATALAAPAVAQSSDALYARFTALTGWELRGYSFDSGLTATRVSQWRIPVIAVAPVGRKVSVDLYANFASSTLETIAGTSTLSGLTDTQLRVLYTLQRDRLVASASFNLPTGQRELNNEEFNVAGSVGSNYLSFPVSSVGTGFAATGGVAWAQQAGSWNVGLSGAFRYQGAYTALADSSAGVEYTPGSEFRLRAGADRLLGTRTRLLLGLTFSTFSTDEFTGTGLVQSGRYKPGPRLIGEFGLARQINRGTLTIVAWDYFRTAGDTNSATDPRTEENVFNIEARWTQPVAPRVQIEPSLGFRQYSLKDYRGGRMLNGALGARFGLTESLSAQVVGRFDSGWVYAPGFTITDFTGYGLTVFLRYQR
jgi:hypothetical protein